MMLLDQLLDGLEVGVSAFALCEVRQDATFVLKEETETAVHYVLFGEGVAWRMTGESAPLSPHTIMIIPPGSGLAVTSDKYRRLNLSQPDCAPLPDGWDHLKVGNGLPGLTLACGFVQATYLQIAGLFAYLREPLIVSVAEDTSFREPFHQLLGELAAPKPGTRALAEMLMKQCLIALLRHHADGSGECQVAWLAAHGNQALGRAISVMLDRPEADHTVQSLAEVAGMSRAAFAEHFKKAFGRTPMDFLKEVRLRRGAHLLTATDLPVKTIAARIGFDSRSYFSRAFKDFTGADPASFRANPVALRLNPKDQGGENRVLG